MDILRSLPLLLLLMLPCEGGRVFGIEYDDAYYVVFKHAPAKSERISIFDAEGHPTESVSIAVRVEPKGILESVDKLFKKDSTFANELREDRAPMFDGFVFYNKGDFVMAICRTGTTLDVQPTLDKEYRFSLEQMKEYNRIVNEMRKGLTVEYGSPKGRMYFWEGKQIDGKLPRSGFKSRKF